MLPLFLLNEGCSLPRFPEDIFFLSILMFRVNEVNERFIKLRVRKNWQQKTNDFFCNIAAKHVE